MLLDSRDLELPFRDFPISDSPQRQDKTRRKHNPRKTAIGVSIGMRMACLFVSFGDLELSHLKPNATTRLPIGARLSWNMSLFGARSVWKKFSKTGTHSKLADLSCSRKLWSRFASSPPSGPGLGSWGALLDPQVNTFLGSASAFERGLWAFIHPSSSLRVVL